MTDITDADLAKAIAESLTRLPEEEEREPGVTTAGEVERKNNISRYKADKTLDNMVKQGILIRKMVRVPNVYGIWADRPGFKYVGDNNDVSPSENGK